MKLQNIRKTIGMSQSQLANKANINIRTLQHYEQRGKNFDHSRIDTILKICLALNCKIEDVIENKEYLALIDQYKNSLK